MDGVAVGHAPVLSDGASPPCTVLQLAQRAWPPWAGRLPNTSHWQEGQARASMLSGLAVPCWGLVWL